MDTNIYDFIYKIIIIGDSGVGKSNILSRFVNDKFELNTKHTIGVEFSTKTLIINNDSLKIQIWDTAGQERYRAITSAYYRGAHGALIVYDITKKQTFDNLDRWIDELNDYTFNNCAGKQLPLILIGNKTDLCHLRQISTESGISYSREKNVHFLETSAMSNTNVYQAFDILIKNIHSSCLLKLNNDDKDIEKELPQSQSIIVTNNPNPTKYKCCL